MTIEQHLIRDARRRTKQRNELDIMSMVAIGAGVVMLLTVLWYWGFVVDVIISLLELDLKLG